MWGKPERSAPVCSQRSREEPLHQGLPPGPRLQELLQVPALPPGGRESALFPTPHPLCCEGSMQTGAKRLSDSDKDTKRLNKGQSAVLS